MRLGAVRLLCRFRAVCPTGWDHRGVSEGVYVSEEHRARKRKRIAGMLAAFGVVLGASSYVVTSLVMSRNDTVTGDTGALAPIVSHEPSTPLEPTVWSASPVAPAPGIGPATKSA